MWCPIRPGDTLYWTRPQANTRFSSDPQILTLSLLFWSGLMASPFTCLPIWKPPVVLTSFLSTLHTVNHWNLAASSILKHHLILSLPNPMLLTQNRLSTYLLWTVLQAVCESVLTINFPPSPSPACFPCSYRKQANQVFSPCVLVSGGSLYPREKFQL